MPEPNELRVRRKRRVRGRAPQPHAALLLLLVEVHVPDHALADRLRLRVLLFPRLLLALALKPIVQLLVQPVDATEDRVQRLLEARLVVAHYIN